MKKQCKNFSNNFYTGVFIAPRTVAKFRTLGQLRHRSVTRHYTVIPGIGEMGNCMGGGEIPVFLRCRPGCGANALPKNWI